MCFIFRRCLLDDLLRPRQPDDVSKPLENSFRHTGHGDSFGTSWGNPMTIENVTFRKAKNTSDGSKILSSFVSPISDRRKSMFISIKTNL